MENSLPLNDCHVSKSRVITNRLHFFIHGVALLFLFHYRLTSLAQIINSPDHSITPHLLPHVLILIAEAILAFIWILSQPSKWRPVVRTPYPERLPADDSLPAVDVFICTADPNKEPSVTVMNTVISAMALDYPPDKLHVYVSDDGGSSVTLGSARLAWDFAKFWIPFCRKYDLKNRCPEAYFLEEENDGHGKVNNGELKEIQRRYEEFKSRVSEIVGETGVPVSKNHPAVMEVISDANAKEDQIPFLAYVAREKRPSHPHHFKAGALNVLFRVSAMITNSPYVLGLDCDMYCNDSSSARQAMCFHLDSKLSPKLGFVQFPQTFYNIAQKDIYDGRMRDVWNKWEGLDGIQGPILSGTGFYLKREAVYGAHKFHDDHADLVKLNKCFGPSNEFIRSMFRNNKPKNPSHVNIMDRSLKKELQLLASCSYDNNTKWGTEVGFRYFSLVEDYFTGMNLHCEGWTSAYVNPPRPCFLGASPISLGEHLFQYTRWNVGLIQIALSRFNPLLYGPLRMSLWQSMCYAEFTFNELYLVTFYVLAIVPQLCLLRGIPLYPQVSSPYFGVFLFVFLSSQLKHMQEVLSMGHSLRVWLTEQRIWMIHAWVAFLYATMDVVLEKFGMRATSFLPTNKAVDDELEKRYRSGIYDFQAAPAYMVPLCSLYMLNVAAFVLGFGRILEGNGTMVIQGLIPLFGMILHFPLFEGMLLRKDKGSVSPSVCLTSALVCATILSCGLVV